MFELYILSAYAFPVHWTHDLGIARHPALPVCIGHLYFYEKVLLRWILKHKSELWWKSEFSENTDICTNSPVAVALLSYFYRKSFEFGTLGWKRNLDSQLVLNPQHFLKDITYLSWDSQSCTSLHKTSEAKNCITYGLTWGCACGKRKLACPPGAP